MKITREFITIIGAGHFVFGALCSVMANNVNDDTKIVICCRHNKKRETIEQTNKAIVSLFEQNGKKFSDFSIDVATNGATLEMLLNNDITKIILLSTDDEELVKFLYNSSHSLFTCVGNGLESVIADINGKVTKRAFVYTCENNYSLSCLLSKNSNTNVKIFPCVIDCICSDMRIEKNEIKLQVEKYRKIILYDPNRHLNEVLKAKTDGEIKLVFDKADIDEEHEYKWSHMNLIHRLLCYKITEIVANNLSYSSAKSIENVKFATYLEDLDIKKYLLEIGTAVAITMFYVFDKTKIKEIIGIDDNGQLFVRYLELDAAERMFNLQRIRRQTNDTIGRIIKTSNEKDYINRIKDTVDNLKTAVRILNEITDDSEFKQQFHIEDYEIDESKKVLEGVISHLLRGL